MYKCLYNLELSIIATTETPWQSYNEPVKRETPAKYVLALENTDVDAIMICPTLFKTKMWHSKLDNYWETDALQIKQPYFTADLKWQDKAYFRLRDYMMKGWDPVQEAVDAAHKIGISPFFSYRMNDHHYIAQENSLIHPPFWKNNPQLWISDELRYFDYKYDEVRKYYYDILKELAYNYDIDGIELDFMRSPVFFRDDEVANGLTIMTGFVRSIREMLDECGKMKNKRLSLCARVPYNVKWAYEAGLDVETWDREKLVDMLNLSTWFICSPEIDVDAFKSVTHNSALYGEMHVLVDKAEMPNGYKNNVERLTTKEMYRALASNFLDRGLDGVSFFNFDYSREHFFSDSRRMHYKNPEPPYEVLVGVSNLEHLKELDKHYFVGPNYSCLPKQDKFELELYVADEPTMFESALLRIKTASHCQGIHHEVKLNGEELEETIWMGELFPPLSIEGFAAPEKTRFYKVPTNLLSHGNNRISVINRSADPTHWEKCMTYETVELALYKHNPFLG